MARVGPSLELLLHARQRNHCLGAEGINTFLYVCHRNTLRCYAFSNSFPAGPDEALQRWVTYYWHLGLNDKEVAAHVLDHFPAGHGLR